MSNLYRMLQDILSIAGSIVEPSNILHQLGMQAVNANFKGCLITLLADDAFDFLPRLLYHFLDAGRMDSSILNQLLQSKTGNLPPDGIESRQNHSLWSIVDDQVDTCERLQCPDVATFASDDAAFHLVVGQSNHRNSCLGHVIRCTALNGCGNNLSSFLFALFFSSFLSFANNAGHIAFDFFANLIEEQFSGFIAGEISQSFQLLNLPVIELLELGLLSLQFRLLAGYSFFFTL